MPTPWLPTICLQLLILHPPQPQPCSAQPKPTTQSNLRRGLFYLSPFRWRYKCCFGFCNPRGYVYIVKFILPNQEAVSGRPFSKRSLRLNQRWEDLGMWPRRRESLFNSLWHPVHSLLSALSASLCPLIKRFRERHQEAEVLRGSFPTLHTNGRYRENPLIWNTQQKQPVKRTKSLHTLMLSASYL